MEKFKKITVIATIVATSITAIYLILMLFGVTLFKNYTSQILFTFGGLAVGGFFAINSLNVISKKKVLGWVSFSLIAVSVVLIDIMSWASLGNLLNITLSFSILSVVFNIIVSVNLELGRKYLPIQIIFYGLSLILDVLATLNIFDVIFVFNAWFFAGLIIDIVGLVVLKVLSKKQNAATQNSNSITISKEEYMMLKEKAAKFDEMTKYNN